MKNKKYHTVVSYSALSNYYTSLTAISNENSKCITIIATKVDIHCQRQCE